LVAKLGRYARTGSRALLPVIGIFASMQLCTAAELPPCTPGILNTPQVFNCGVPQGLQPLEFGAPATYNDARARAAFPQSWGQLGHNQRHDTVFPVPDDAPAFLKEGVFWSTPLTGEEFARVVKSAKYYANDDGQDFMANVAQWLGNTMGVTVAQGIVYAQLSNGEFFAVDAANGKPIWRAKLDNVAGMGQTLVEQIDGRPVVFVTTGDSVFNLENVVRFNNNLPHDRGAGFASVYAFDGVTGEKLWQFNSMAAARSAPVYKDGILYVTSGAGYLYILQARTGELLSRFTNPGEGFVGLASPNWHKTPDGRLLINYGTIRPRNILAVDVTDPYAPSLAWRYSPPKADANSPGDTPDALDPDLSVMVTSVFTNVGTATAPIYDANLIALDASTGTVKWSSYLGQGATLVGFKTSVPMIHDGVVYIGNSLNNTYHAFDIASGARLWQTVFTGQNEPAGRRVTPRAGSIYYDGKIIQTSRARIRTLDAKTGQLLNDFNTRGLFSLWAVNQPVIVGKQAYLASNTGWLFAAPLDYLMTAAGSPDATALYDPGAVMPPLARQAPEFFNPAALPKRHQAKKFPGSWLAYAGGQDHNGYSKKGPDETRWQTALADALPLDGPPVDLALYGAEAATHMTHLAWGVGSGVTAVNGIVYAPSSGHSINALNAVTGELIWRFRTTHANFGQPLVTSSTVVVGQGDPWIFLEATGKFQKKDPTTRIGGGFQSLIGLDPESGMEKWRFYTGGGSSAMTPLHHNGNLYWVSGEGKIFAVNADTGEPLAPFMDARGIPTIRLPGFNAIASANIYHQADGSSLMVIGLGMPNVFYGIDLATGNTVWTQTLPGVASYLTGFAAASPAVDQERGLVVSTLLIDANVTSSTATLLAIALDAKSGNLVWSRALGTGPIPYGWAAPTPVLARNQVFLSDPLSSTSVALNVETGVVEWQAPLEMANGKLNWGPGVVVKHRLIQPSGADLVVLDTRTGVQRNRVHVGGAFVYNNPTVAGETLYIGNSWGWVTALPLERVLEGRD
jgi:outer membrane protein assembly factor BamB